LTMSELRFSQTRLAMDVVRASSGHCRVGSRGWVRA
jgi:hypothetical protein